MKPIRQQMIQHLMLRHYSERTIKAYLDSVKGLIKFYDGLPPGRISNGMIQDYLMVRIQKEKISWNTCHRDLYGISYLYSNVFHRDVSDFFVPGRKTLKYLPKPLSRDQIRRLFQVTNNLKHRTILTTIYGSGVRVCEAAHLKIRDIEGSRNLIRVDQGKGNKDRYTILPKTLLEQLRSYYRVYRPVFWVFTGREQGQPIPVGTLQRIFYNAKDKAGITAGRGIHTLRHSFATHMVEAGWDILVVQKLLGHKWVRTTANNIHVSQTRLNQVRSPLDSPEFQQLRESES